MKKNINEWNINEKNKNEKKLGKRKQNVKTNILFIIKFKSTTKIVNFIN
jgi:hypothetical protein